MRVADDRMDQEESKLGGVAAASVIIAAVDDAVEESKESVSEALDGNEKR